MRHRIHHRKLNRTSQHRRALLRNMAQSLIEHGQITTTIPKAKNLRPYIERLVTLAVKSRNTRRPAAMTVEGAIRHTEHHDTANAVSWHSPFPNCTSTFRFRPFAYVAPRDL